MEKRPVEMVPIDITTINEGAMIEGFGIELQKCLENIADINTPATTPRVVELKLTLKPHADRVVIETEFACKSKLAPIEKHASKIFLGRTENRDLIAFGSDPRQMVLFSPPEPKEVAAPIEFRQTV